MACEHMNFDVHAAVARIQKSDLDPTFIAFHVDITCKCHECHEPFEWVGLPLGFSHYRPTVSIDGQIMHAPLVPKNGEVPEGLAGFSVTMQTFPEKEPTRQ